MKEIKANTYSEIVKSSNEFSAGKRIIWRGHSDSNWKLNSSLKRYLDDQVGLDYNDRIELEEKSISCYLEKDRRDESCANIFLAMVNLQHYGCPTRLIDFTLSQYVALFFAIRDIGDYRVIYGFDEEYLIEENIRKASFDAPTIPLPYLDNEYFKIIRHKHIDYNPFPIHYKGNVKRIAEQQSVFMYETDISDGSNEYLESLSDTQGIKIIFPSSIDKIVVDNLMLMNLDGTHLFETEIGIAENAKLGLRGLLNSRYSYKEFDDPK